MQAENPIAEAATHDARPESAKTEGFFVTGFEWPFARPVMRVWLGWVKTSRLAWVSVLSGQIFESDMLG